ncbi:MAG: ATP synthase F1 subunit delta [Burkholderiales bacterium]|nr:ATP synthase F1 subunit delta [Phycisphaerae bacterium]
MSTTQDDKATLTSYARAILDLGDARGTTNELAEEIQGVAEVIRGDATFARYLGDPSVGSAKRADLIDAVFGGSLSGVLVAFLKLLNSKNRLGTFPGVAVAFKELLDARSGNVEVSVTVPQALSDAELEDVRRQISTKLGKNAVVKQEVDESIIGGLILKIGDSMIDGSVKTQLETLKRRLVAAV